MIVNASNQTHTYNKNFITEFSMYIMAYHFSFYFFIFVLFCLIVYFFYYINVNRGRDAYILSGGEENPGPIDGKDDRNKKSSAGAPKKGGMPSKTSTGAHNGSAKSQTDSGSAPHQKGTGNSQPTSSTASSKSSPHGSNESLASTNSNGRGKSQKGSGSAPHNKGAGVSRSTSKAISIAESTHKFSKVYDAAVKQGFKNRAALDLFNVWVRANLADISPDKLTVCMDCGEANLALCEHFIRAASPVEVVEDHLLIPNGKAAYTFTWSFIGRIRHMFAMPKFDFSVQNNHNLGGFDNSMIGDENIISSLYNYLKINKDVSYRMNGVDKRDVRMAHMRKLSHRWLAEIKINPTSLDTTQVNSIILTCQRVCDEAESDMLQSYNNPTQNFGQACMGFLLRIAPRLVIGGVCCAIVYKSRRLILNAGVRTTVYSAVILVKELVLLLHRGSMQILNQTYRQIVNPSIGATLNFARYSLPPYLTSMTASSCQIARTMCSSLYTNVTLKTLPAAIALSRNACSIASSTASPQIWPPAWCYLPIR